METFWKQLNGTIPSYEDKNCFCYSTNHGTIKINKYTRAVEYACVGFTDTGDGDKRVIIKIMGSEISIQTGSLYRVNAELTTTKFPYKTLGCPRPDLTKVFDTLYNNSPMSIPFISVILRIIQVFKDKLTREEFKHASELIRLIKFRHSRSILRTPATSRVPIIL